MIIGIFGQERLEFSFDCALDGMLRNPLNQARCLDILKSLKGEFFFHNIVLHILIFIFVVVMAATSGLGSKIEIALIIFILEESSWHTSLTCNFTITTIQACFESSSFCDIKVVIVALIINVSFVVA